MKIFIMRFDPLLKHYRTLQGLKASPGRVPWYIRIMLFLILLWRIFMGATFRGFGLSNRRSIRRMLWHWQAAGNSDTPLSSVAPMCCKSMMQWITDAFLPCASFSCLHNWIHCYSLNSIIALVPSILRHRRFLGEVNSNCPQFSLFNLSSR